MWPFESTTRSRSGQSGFFGSCFNTWKNQKVKISAMPRGPPVWPEAEYLSVLVATNDSIIEQLMSLAFCSSSLILCSVNMLNPLYLIDISKTIINLWYNTFAMITGPNVLTFEEFSARDKANFNAVRYGNFYRHFDGSAEHKARWYYGKFEDENMELVMRLLNKIRDMDESRGISTALRPCDRLLYEAYVIMRGYRVPDEELFA